MVYSWILGRYTRIINCRPCCNLYIGLMYIFLGPTQRHISNGISVQPFLKRLRSWQKDRLTDRPRHRVCYSMPHLYVLRRGLKIFRQHWRLGSRNYASDNTLHCCSGYHLHIRSPASRWCSVVMTAAVHVTTFRVSRQAYTFGCVKAPDSSTGSSHFL